MSSLALRICIAQAAASRDVTESSMISRSVDAFWYRLYRFQLSFPLRFGLSTIWIKTLFSNANLLNFFASSVSFSSAPTGNRRSGLRGCCGSNSDALRSVSSASRVRGPTLSALANSVADCRMLYAGKRQLVFRLQFLSALFDTWMRGHCVG